MSFAPPPEVGPAIRGFAGNWLGDTSLAQNLPEGAPSFRSPWFSPGFCCRDAQPNPSPSSLFGRATSCGPCLIFSIPQSSCSGARWVIQMSKPCCQPSLRLSASLSAQSISVSILGLSLAAPAGAVRLSRQGLPCKNEILSSLTRYFENEWSWGNPQPSQALE